MNITNIEPTPSINRFKNKEDFCNRLIHEVMVIYNNNPLMIKTNKKMTKIENYKQALISKNENLDRLLKKSSEMTNDLNSKINILTEDNNNYKNKLLEILLRPKEEI